MPPTGLVIEQILGATVVNFRDVSILDGSAVDAISRELYALVEQQARRKIILDFTAVRFLSSSMIGVVLSVNKKALAIKGQVVICGLREELHKVFKIMRLEKVLAFAKDERQAMELLGISTPG